MKKGDSESNYYEFSKYYPKNTNNFTGGTSSVQVDTKDILMEAIKIGAPKIIMVHNHPSGKQIQVLQI